MGTTVFTDLFLLTGMSGNHEILIQVFRSVYGGHTEPSRYSS